MDILNRNYHIKLKYDILIRLLEKAEIMTRFIESMSYESNNFDL